MSGPAAQDFTRDSEPRYLTMEGTGKPEFSDMDQ